VGERLTWRIERNLLPEPLPRAADPERGRPAPRPRWTHYGLVLLLAAAMGFGLGRWAETEGRLWAAVQDNLALAQLAIDSGDRDLLGRTLDPDSPGSWREAELARQLGRPRAPGAADLRDIQAMAADLLRVRLNSTAGDGADEELRFYRRVGDRWLQTAPLQPGGGSGASQP
jgi:hypothetical protein